MCLVALLLVVELEKIGMLFLHIPTNLVMTTRLQLVKNKNKLRIF